MEPKFDIFISYKRKSWSMANNLYYRLTIRGYSTFYDIEEMRRDNFNVQILNYIDKSKDVFVILEDGSLDACYNANWEKDWFCKEIAYALEKKKNIIPILLDNYKMPSEDFFPDKLKELSLKHGPDFSPSYFNEYLDKLVELQFITSKPNNNNKTTSVFKFYSNENCQVFKEEKMVCSLKGMSDVPYYLPVFRKGDYRFKVVNDFSKEVRILKEQIDSDEEKEVDIQWKYLNSSVQYHNKQERVNHREPKSDVFICRSIYDINIANKLFNLFKKHSITYFDDKEAPNLSDGIDCGPILKRKIIEAKAVVYLSSINANNSENVKEELKFIRQCHKSLIILKLDTTPYMEEHANFLSIPFNHKIDTTYYNESVEKELVELINSKKSKKRINE